MKTINSVLQRLAVQTLAVACCTCIVVWNTGAAARTAGRTVPGSPVPPEGGLLQQGWV